MRTVTAMDMRKRLGEILDAASAGERILIERDHKPLAFLVSYEEGQALSERDEEKIKRQLDALDDLVEFAKAWRQERGTDPDEMSAAEWIRWDRDHRDDDKRERSVGKAVGGEREARRRQVEDEG